MSCIDDQHEGLASNILQGSFGLSIQQIFRSGFGLFALAGEEHRHGFLEMSEITCDEELTRTQGVSVETLESLLSNICTKEADLYKQWYREKVSKLHAYYQCYAPIPLTTTPVIHLNKSGQESRKYLIPSPGHYIRGFRQAVFSKLFEQNNQMGDILGKSIESHIFDCLVKIFGEQCVQKIDHDGKKADFCVSLKQVDLVIECKSQIGSFDERMIFNPEHLANIWARLYKACTQCSASIEQLRKENRPIVAIILVADHITLEPKLFQKIFGQDTDLFESMGIDVLECISWNELESILWETSVEEFENGLLKKVREEDSRGIRDWLFERDENSPKYDYLDKAEQEIFPWND